jgi:hypothetical protein
MVSSRARLPGLLLALAISLPASADSIRCDRGIVGVGDTRLDLLGRCGEPTLRERAVVERAVAVDAAAAVSVERRLAVVRDRWTYDLGRDRFAQTVVLEDGRVVAVERGGRGYAESAPRAPARVRRARCEPSALREGASGLDLLARCGDPALREEALERRTVVRREPHVAVEAATTLRVETWTYDFGPSRFAMLVTLEDGLVVRVERASYGYAE